MYEPAIGRRHPCPRIPLVADQLGLQLQVGNDMSAVKDSVRAVEDDFSSVKNGVQAVEEGMHLYKASFTLCASNG